MDIIDDWTLPWPAIKVPTYQTRRVGAWELRRQNQPVLRGYFRGLQACTENYLLMRDNRVWMSLSPVEIESLAPHVAHMRGHVVIAVGAAELHARMGSFMGRFRCRGCRRRLNGPLTPHRRGPPVTAQHSGKERHRVGDHLDAAPCSAWSGRIVIAKPVDPTRGQVNEMTAAGPGPISRLEARRSAHPHHRYKVTPKSCPTCAGGLRAAMAPAKAAPCEDRLDITATILEVITLTRTEMHRNGVFLRTRLAPDLPFVQGDRVQLQQVMLNLILNAVEALSGTSGGLRELLISSESDGPNGVRSNAPRPNG
jgi:hypothetical protein